VADGGRGRRWRAVTTDDGGRLESALLVEAAPDGRLLKVEAASAAGLLTLHPDGHPRRLHGNLVRAGGIEHVTLPWSDAHLLFVGVSPVSAAVAAAALRTRVGVGEGASVPAVQVGADLGVMAATWRIARVGERRWRMLAADGGPSLVVDLDADGIPTTDDAESWPLEVDANR